MAIQYKKMRILLRRGTLAEWENVNPILSAGEMGVALDIGKCKIGDGNTHWHDLSFFAMASDLNDYAKVIIKTQDEWIAQSFVKSQKGQIYIYVKKNIEEDALISARMKVGDGKTFIFNLPFIEDVNKELFENHIQNTAIHTSLEEKTFWSNKININDTSGVIDNILIFNRN